jgi:hypothetical protein
VTLAPLGGFPAVGSSSCPTVPPSSSFPSSFLQLYQSYEEQSYKKLNELIEKRAGSLPKAIFTDFADKIYKRAK